MARMKTARVVKPSRGARLKRRLNLNLQDTLERGLEAMDDVSSSENDSVETRHSEQAIEDAEDMEVDTQEDDALSQSVGKGKGRLMETGHEVVNTSPLVDEREKEMVFPLMDLPTEIRLEIYRACLTRPYKISFSRMEQRESRVVEAAAKHSDRGEADPDEERQPPAALQRLIPSTLRGTDLARIRRLTSNMRPVARVTRPSRFTRSSSMIYRASTTGSSSNETVRSRHPAMCKYLSPYSKRGWSHRTT